MEKELAFEITTALELAMALEIGAMLALEMTMTLEMATFGIATTLDRDGSDSICSPIRYDGS